MGPKIKGFLGKLKNDRKILTFSILAVLLVAAIPTTIIISTSKKNLEATAAPKEPQDLAANESNSQVPNSNSATVNEKTTDANAPADTTEPKSTENTDKQIIGTDTNASANTSTNTKSTTAASNPAPVGNTYGNTSGNLTNAGRVVSDGQYVYYINSSDGYKLYRSKPDGSSKSKISDSICSSLNIVGDWIYYSDAMRNPGIYKMKKDGSGKIQLTNNQTMGIAVVNDLIYYMDGAVLYKIKTDGSGKTKINFGTNNSFVSIEAEDIVVIGDWVYLPLINKAESMTQLCRVKTDGSIAQKVLNDSPRFYSIENGWVYYADRTYKKINKAKVDGSSQTTIYTLPDANYNIYSVNVSNGYVYFSNDTESQSKDKLGIFKIKIDGSGVTQLLNGAARFLNIAANWIYFEAPGSSSPTYSNGTYKVVIGGSSQMLKLKTDGSQLLQVN